MYAEKKIKVVIGASYGDEGKGLMTEYFCSASEKPIVVCHNGGAQRGHTVSNADGFRHVFRHLGAGTRIGADTYLSEDFIINPIIFGQEYDALSPRTDIYFSPLCRWSTPFDMMLNQIAEDHRGNGRHGSCGMGIFETETRYKKGCSMSLTEFSEADRTEQTAYLKYIRDKYFSERLAELNIKLPDEWKETVYSERLISNFTDDCKFFTETAKTADIDVLENYPDIIFEGGQGLLLSRVYRKFTEHVTPSFTGAENPVKLIGKLNGTKSIEVCYVTRSYITRHGAGEFPDECPKEAVNADMTDPTNAPNQYQGSLRYGKTDIPAVNRRIHDDFRKFRDFENANMSAAVTHLNETEGKLITVGGTAEPSAIRAPKIYLSDSVFSENITENN